MNDQVSIKELIVWHRSKAKDHERMANDIERALRITEFEEGVPIVESVARGVSDFAMEIREAIENKGKAMRTGELSKRFNVHPTKIIESVEKPGSGLDKAGKGWIKLSNGST